ncbi:hypothetical protein HanIR_Chr16g0829231 [Helianthus annuus]|nr:hypothetical protein HanIR_Chr16g0829231 [Helianthus annuus]
MNSARHQSGTYSVGDVVVERGYWAFLGVIASSANPQPRVPKGTRMNSARHQSGTYSVGDVVVERGYWAFLGVIASSANPQPRVPKGAYLIATAI